MKKMHTEPYQHVAAHHNAHTAVGCRGLQTILICQGNGHTKLGRHSPAKKKVTQKYKIHTKRRNTRLTVVQHIAAQNGTHAAEGCRGLRDKLT